MIMQTTGKGITRKRMGAVGTSAQTAKKKWSKRVSLTWSIVIVAIGVALVVGFFYVDRTDRISNAIQSYGALGIVLSILLMALFCVIPVPSEFLMIMNMKVFGVWWGIFYTWIGAMLGAVAVFFLARYIGGRLLEPFVDDQQLDRVNGWIKKRGAIGLLLARLVPLPFIVVNYAAGVLKSVNVWEYVWTTGIGLLPYDIGAALVFLGFATRYTLWLIVGGLAIVAIWIVGYLYHRQVHKAQRLAH
jgi:uncharacterized membrane protein YdjX (TVP38/TMEM64 family)